MINKEYFKLGIYFKYRTRWLYTWNVVIYIDKN